MSELALSIEQDLTRVETIQVFTALANALALQSDAFDRRDDIESVVICEQMLLLTYELIAQLREATP